MRRNPPTKGKAIDATLARIDDIAEEIVMSTRKLARVKDPGRIIVGDIEDLGTLIDTLTELYDELEEWATQ